MSGTLINFIVDKYLSNILEIDKNKTYSSLLGGKLNMSNLKIKKELFDSLNLPYFEVIHGFVGEIDVEFSPLTIWRNPIKVKISNVFFMMRQKALSNLEEESEIKKMEEYKASKLLSVEEFKSNLKGAETQPGIIQQIINNLDIQISDVVFRFEDNVSYKEKPFAFGIIMKNLIIKTTDYSFSEDLSGTVAVDTINYKIIKLDQFNIFLDYKDKYSNFIAYLEKSNSIDSSCGYGIKSYTIKDIEKERDINKEYLGDNYEFYLYCLSELNIHYRNENAHNYLLYQLVSNLKLTINTNPEANYQPQTEACLDLEDINLSLNLDQIKIVLKLLSFINLNTLYLVGLEKKYYNKTPSENEKNDYLDAYNEYFKHQYNPKYKDTNKAKLIMEKDVKPKEKQLTFDQIYSMRKAAYIKFNYLGEIERIDDEIKRIKGRWKVTSLFTSSSDAKTLEELEMKKKQLIEKEDQNVQEIQDKLNKVGQENNELDIDYLKNMPEDWIKMKLEFNLSKLNFYLNENSIRKLILIVVTNFKIDNLMGKSFLNASLSLEDFYVQQFKTDNKLFDKIMQSYNDPYFKEKLNKSATIKDDEFFNENLIDANNNNKELSNKTNNKALMISKSKEKALFIDFKMNPKFAKTNYKLFIRNDKRLLIFGNLYSLSYIGDRIASSMKGEIDFSEMQRLAGEEAAKYMNEGKTYANKLVQSEYVHVNADVDLLLKGPIIVLPQDVLNLSNKKAFLLSMGIFKMKSYLAEKKNIDDDYTKLRDFNKLYDKYSMHLEDFELSSVWDYEDENSIKKTTTKLNLIKNVVIELNMANIIEPKNLYYENFIVEFKIHNIGLTISDKHLKFIVEYLSCFSNSNKKLEKELNKLRSIDISEKSHTDNNLSKNENTNVLKNKDIIENNALNADESSNIPLTNLNNKENISLKSKKSKDIMSFVFKLEKIEFSMLKSIGNEEIDLFKSEGLEYNDKENKIFIHYLINRFSFEIKLSDSFDTIIDIKLYNLFLFDRDFNYVLSEDKTIVEESIVNQEFICIIGSINEDNDNINNNNNSQSRSLSLYSEAYNLDSDQNQLLDSQDFNKIKKKREVDFVSINVKYNSETAKTDIQANFTKLLICLNLNTIERMALYFKEVTDYQNILFNNSTNSQLSKTKTIKGLKRKSLLDKLNEEKKEENEVEYKTNRNTNLLNKINTNNSNKDQKDSKNEIFKKIILKMKKRKEIALYNKDLDSDELSSIKSKKQNFKNLLSKNKNNNNKVFNIKKKDIIKLLDSDIYKQESKSSLKLSVTMKDIEVNFPLDSLNKNTKVLVMNVNTLIKLSKDSIIENVYCNKNNNLLKTNYIVNDTDINILINNFDLDIIYFINNTFIINERQERLMLNSRITLELKQFLILKKETSVTNIMLNIEPIFLQLGYRQIQILNQFSTVIFEYKDKFMNGELTSQGNSQGQFKSQLAKSIEEYDAELAYKESFNIANFNNLTDVTINLDKCVLQILDNISSIHASAAFPLIKIDLSKIILKYVNNTEPYDINNVAKVIVEIISTAIHGNNQIGKRYQHNYNISNLFMYIDIYFNVNINYFNDKFSNWEPLIEPWNLNILQLQVLKTTKLRIDIISDNILNLNVSVNSMRILNNLLKVNNEGYFFKTDEFKKNKIKRLSNNDVSKLSRNNTSIKSTNSKEKTLINAKEVDLKKYVKTLSIKNSEKAKNKIINDISLQIINELGIDCEFSFNAKADIEFTLCSESTRSFTKNDINKIYYNLSEEELLFLKDKLMLRIYDKNIEEIDFSYNNISVLSIEDSRDISQKNDYRNQLQITIKIINYGTIKQIIISSNLSFYNSTKQSIKFAILDSKYATNEGIVDFNKANISKVAPNEHYIIPIKYTIGTYMLFAEVIYKDNNYYEDINEDENKDYTSGMKLIYYDLKQLKGYLNDSKEMTFRDLKRKYTISIEFESQKDNDELLKDEKMLNNKNKSLYAFDMLAWHGNEDEDDDNDNNEVNSKKDEDNMLSRSEVIKKGLTKEFGKYDIDLNTSQRSSFSEAILVKKSLGLIIVISCPFQFQNLIPYNTLLTINNDLLISELKNIGKNSNKNSNVLKEGSLYDCLKKESNNNDIIINPLDTQDIYSINLLDNIETINNDNIKDKFKAEENNINNKIKENSKHEQKDLFTNINIIIEYLDTIFVSETIDLSSILLNNPDKDHKHNTYNDKNKSNKNIIDIDHYKKFSNKLKFYNSKNTLDFIYLYYYFEDFSIDILHKTLAHQKEYLSSTKKLVLYSEFLVINRTMLNYHLKLETEKIDLNSKDYSNKLKSINTIMNKRISLYSPYNHEFKANIRSFNSDWSKDFDITSLGVSGVLSLNTKPDDSNQILKENKNSNINNYNITDIAVSITSSNYFTNSTLILIEPRYVFVNKLPFDVRLYQDCNEKNELFNKYFDIKKNEELSNIDFAFKNLKHTKKYFKFGHKDLINKSSLEVINERLTSPLFNIENIDDFTTSIEVPNVYELENPMDEKSRCFKINYSNEKSNSINNYNESLLVRVIVQTKGYGIIYIIITLSYYPQYLIENETDEKIFIKQKNLDTLKNTIEFNAKSTGAYIWSKFLDVSFEVEVSVELTNYNNNNYKFDFNFEKLEKNYTLKMPEKNKILVFNLDLINQGFTRVLNIKEKRTKELSASKNFLLCKNKNDIKIFNLNVHMEGFGISLIDETPKELFFISVYSLDLRLSDLTMTETFFIEKTQNIEIYLKNFQIDYCLKSQFNLLISPSKQILPDDNLHLNDKKLNDNEEKIPFIQILLTKKTYYEIRTSNTSTKFTQIDFLMQEINLKIDQIALNSMMKLANSVMSELDYSQTSLKNNQANKQEVINLTDKNTIINTFETMPIASPQEYCPMLSLENPNGNEVLKASLEAAGNMIFIDVLMISAMKIKLTLRIDISSLHIGLVPKFIIKFLGTVGNSLMRISDSPLKFNEIILQECFSNYNKISTLLISHYARQGMFQFYKVLGSSDLIGNPVGLLDKIGTGFIEFFNEPRKGFLQGPDKFGKGIAKGINSLVSGIVGGSFDAIGKISGTLLYAAKNITGNDNKLNNIDYNDEPNNVLSGVGIGVYSGVKEIGKGIAGIFINPYKGAKTKGAKGFFVGVGTGLMGAVVSPFAGALTIINNVSVGMKNTANMFNKGKISTERFRHPRHISRTKPLEPYDPNYAEVQEIMRRHLILKAQKLIFFYDFKSEENAYNKSLSTIIVSDKKIIVVYNAKDLIINIDFNNLYNTEVHNTKHNQIYLLVFFIRRRNKSLFSNKKNMLELNRQKSIYKDNNLIKCYLATKDLEMCINAHMILQNLIEKKKNINKSIKKKKQ